MTFVLDSDVSDEMSTNSDDNFPYGIPNHASSPSSTSDNGYGTKTKDTDDSLRTSSHHRSRGRVSVSFMEFSALLSSVFSKICSNI